jgi:hypothetical protein
MWRTDDGTDGFGAMCQMFRADAYRGRRVRFSAFVRTENAQHAGLCLRVDGPETVNGDRPLAFDNMDPRPICGTTEWTKYACVVDVSERATEILVGNILTARGDFYWSDLRFEVVDESVPSTDFYAASVAAVGNAPATPLPPEPVNLDFTSAPRAEGDPLLGRAPAGWRLWGSHARVYCAELTSETFDGKPVVRMVRLDESTEGGAGMVQTFDARAYCGRRIRLSAALRAVEVGRARLTLRVDGPGHDNVLAFDNMEPRLLKGTTHWARYACVVDVPPEATTTYVSGGLGGGGELYVSDYRFEVVDESVPVTDMMVSSRRKSPVNLDFSEE